MIRKLLASCAALALACSPGYAAGWYPGFTGTGQVAPGTGGGGTQTAGCATTPGYVGLGDCQGTATIVRHYGLRAMSYQAAQLGVYIGQVCGSGVSGGAAAGGVCAYLRANTDGTPNLTGATLVSGGTVTNLTPSSGSATTNPCYSTSGTDGACRIFMYDQQTQVSNGAAATTGPAATAGSTARLALYQNCSNFAGFTVSLTRSCAGISAAGGTNSLTDTSLTATAQPYSLMGVFQEPSTGVSRYGFLATGTLGTNGGIAATATVNSWSANAGTNISFTVAQSAAVAANVYFNSATGTSLVQANGTNTALSSVGAGQLGTTLYISQNSGGNVSAGIFTEVEVTTGAQTAAQMGAAASNENTYYGLGF